MEDRLPTHTWVEAVLHKAHLGNVPGYVLQKGNKTGGQIIVKVVNLKGSCKLFSEQRDLDGVLGWHEEEIEERAADERIAQEKSFDPDLWVIEFEDPEMANPFKD